METERYYYAVGILHAKLASFRLRVVLEEQRRILSFILSWKS